MTGYRRIEPAFCRGCGTPWVPGADACSSCGEAIAREPARTGDPYALRKLWVGIALAVGVIAISWVTSLLAMDALLDAPVAWIAGTLGVYGLVLLVTQFAFRGGLKPILRAPPRKAAWGEAIVAGLVVAGGMVLLDEHSQMPGAFALSGVAGLVAFAVLAGLEELLFRGILFEGVAAFGGKWNAAIASTLLFCLMFFTVPAIALGLAASLLRVRVNSVWPVVVFRLVLSGVIWAVVSDFGSSAY